MDIKLTINEVPVLGSIKIRNTIYYVDKNKSIYTFNNNTYNKVEDIETLREILKHISPRSLDVKEKEI